MKILPFIMSSVLVSATSLTEIDHLVPCESAFNDAYSTVPEWSDIRNAVTEGFQIHPQVAYYAIPAFDGPHAFQILEKRNETILVTNELTKSFTEILHGEVISNEHYQKPIDAGLSKRLEATWKRFVLDSHYPKETDTFSIHFDGVDHYFSSSTDYGIVSGTTWSPDKEKNPTLYNLVLLADSIFEYSKSNSQDTSEIEATLKKIENIPNQSVHTTPASAPR